MRVLVDRHGMLERAAVIDLHGRLQDLYVDRYDQKSLYGAVYQGRILHCCPQKNGAFIDIGYKYPAWINRSDLEHARKTVPTLTQGHPIQVQVCSDPTSTKGPRVHCDIRLVGRYLVFMPMSERVHVSRRCGTLSPNSLIQYLKSLPHSGWIIRSSSCHTTLETVSLEAERLLRIWQECISETSAPPVQLLSPKSVGVCALLAANDDPLDEIRVETREQYKHLTAWGTTWLPEILPILVLHQEQHRVFDVFGLEEEFILLTSRTLPLNCGGTLVIDVTEALTVIDVNSGSATSLITVNLEAAQEIARQIRLRNLSGIIVIDFLRMSCHKHRTHVEKALRLTLDKDPLPTHLHGWTKLGLFEITRTKRRPPLTSFSQQNS